MTMAKQPYELKIPQKDSDIFSRKWYAGVGWKLDEPTLMIKVDTTREKMRKITNKVVRLGTDGIIPEWLYSSLDERLRFLHSSIGVYRILTKMQVPATTALPFVHYMDKYHQIYPSRRDWEKLDWDDVLLGDKRKRMEYGVVMPSIETVRWLNEVNEYCNGMEEWGNGTYLQTKEKLEASKGFLKNIHKQLIVSGNVYITEEEARRGLGL